MQAADLLASAALALAGPALTAACAALARGWLPDAGAVVGGVLLARAAIGILHALLRSAGAGPSAGARRA